MAALSNPLFPAAELMERELTDRQVLGEDDLIQWVMEAKGPDSDYAATGEVVWVKRTEGPRRLPVFFKSFVMSLEGTYFEAPAGSSIVPRLAALLVAQRLPAPVPGA